MSSDELQKGYRNQTVQPSPNNGFSDGNSGMCVSVGCNTTGRRKSKRGESSSGLMLHGGNGLGATNQYDASGYNLMSLNRYMHQQNDYQIDHLTPAPPPPPERFSDDNMVTCCLPPPSPAPTSDRFVMGMPAPSPTPPTMYQDHRYSLPNTHQTLSPNSRYRTSSSSNNNTHSDHRYRDLSPKCDRFMSNSSHYLASSTPIPSADHFPSYLSSTLHTPVKRYVPTPPPQTNPMIINEGYPDTMSNISTSSNNSACSTNYHQHLCSSGGGNNGLSCSTNTPPQSSALQSSGNVSLPRNTVPYKLRLKCCVNEAQQTDHYATPPRARPLKCSPSNCSTTTMTSSNIVVTRGVHQDYQLDQAPNIEYMGPSGRVVSTTPVNLQADLSGNLNPSCTHCSTMRRTTGVHQTTQTTGPISPIPTPMSSLSESQSIESGIQDNMNVNIQNGPPSPPSISSISSMTLKLQSVHQPSSHQSLTQTTLCSQQPSQSVSPVPSLITSTNQTLQNHDYTAQMVDPKPIQEALPPLNSMTINRSIILQQQQPPPQQQHSPTVAYQRGGTLQHRHPHLQQIRLSRKQRIKNYLKSEVAKFFGVDQTCETHERIKWCERQKRLAIRRFGQLTDSNSYYTENYNHENAGNANERREQQGDRPDILPAQNSDEITDRHMAYEHVYGHAVERKASVYNMALSGMTYIVQMLCKKGMRKHYQWSRSFAPTHCMGQDDVNDICDGLSPLQEDEVFFETPNSPTLATGNSQINHQIIEQSKIYIGERVQGWRTKSTETQNMNQQTLQGIRGQRISAQCLDGVLDNSRRPVPKRLKLFRPNELDDRHDYRPFFTYWINTVQILVLTVSMICYGLGPIGIGMEQKSGQVLVTSLSLQQVQHQEQRNVWIGLRNDDLVHLGAKYAACMRRDTKILEVISKTRRQERETACCIRNDDSGCVQSSQADCSIRGLWPTKSISTWKKWSPGESGPGGRISGSVCGLDPKYCDAPASIAPYEWPDDITKWPICRKTNSFSQRFRFKDHTAEHMVCEVIGHPCCTGIYGECRITTREYCDFVNGYFHEEASLCSQVSCLNDVCGMFPFMATDYPDQLYRLFTSLCLHAGILHLAITVAFQHIFLADLERLLGPIRTATLYIFSGVAGNLTSAILVPYKPEVGPLASLAGIVASLSVLLLLIHWKQLKKPHLALIKMLVIIGTLFGIGTLPWQQNFAGLIAGIISGVVLTVALVPFVSLTKYGRKTKINLIWSIMLFYFIIYVTMFIIFYLFPSAFTNLWFGDAIYGGTPTFGGNLNNFYGTGGFSNADGGSGSNNQITSSSNNNVIGGKTMVVGHE